MRATREEIWRSVGSPTRDQWRPAGPRGHINDGTHTCCRYGTELRGKLLMSSHPSFDFIHGDILGSTARGSWTKWRDRVLGDSKQDIMSKTLPRAPNRCRNQRLSSNPLDAWC